MKNSCGTAAVLLAVAGLGFGLSAHANEKLSGSTLLTASDQQQLGAWLGEGAIALTNIYSKAQGDTSVNFHAAADGKGRTFSVMQATNEFGRTWLVGGYNPQSWSSAGSYNMTLENAQRTAFLFNLTSGSIYRQTPSTYSLGTVGAYQTFNHSAYGPTFGTGYDLYVPANLTSGGYSSLYSYIDPATSGFDVSVVDGTYYHRPNITFGAIEVFSISAVPEPGSASMLLAGVGLLSGIAFLNKKSGPKRQA